MMLLAAAAAHLRVFAAMAAASTSAGGTPPSTGSVPTSATAGPNIGKGKAATPVNNSSSSKTQLFYSVLFSVWVSNPGGVPGDKFLFRRRRRIECPEGLLD